MGRLTSQRVLLALEEKVGKRLSDRDRELVLPRINDAMYRIEHEEGDVCLADFIDHRGLAYDLVGLMERLSSVEPPRRQSRTDIAPERAEATLTAVMEAWTLLPKKDKEDARGVMHTMLKLYRQILPPVWQDAEEAKRLLWAGRVLSVYYDDSDGETAQYLQMLEADSPDTWESGYVMVRVDQHLLYTRLPEDIPPLRWSVIAQLVHSAWLLWADAVTFALFPYQPDHPTAPVLFHKHLHSVQCRFPTWLPHRAVQHIWQAVHTNLRPSVVAAYTAERYGISAGEWNSIAPREWRFTHRTAFTNATRRARRKLERP